MCAQDAEIGQRVYRITGSAPTGSLQIPQFGHMGSQSLGLTGRFAYIEFRPMVDQPFTVHLDVHVSRPSNILDAKATALRSSAGVDSSDSKGLSLWAQQRYQDSGQTVRISIGNSYEDIQVNRCSVCNTNGFSARRLLER